jgi:hypothetical protein
MCTSSCEHIARRSRGFLWADGFVSHITPAEYFAAHANTNIIAASHTACLAEANSAGR